jgi:calmodulin
MYLSDEELKEFKEIFNLVDTDQGGSISTEELGNLMETLGIKTTTEELKLMVSEIDANGNGEVDFDEFVQVMSRKVNADYNVDEVQKAFKVFAGNAPDGHILISDLEKALQNYGKDKLSEEEAKSMVAQIESNADGFFNYGDYVSMMLQR